MTRAQIAEGLTLLVMQLANNESRLPDGWEPHEWAYVKGIASAEVLRLRDRLTVTWNSPPPGGLSESHGGD